MSIYTVFRATFRSGIVQQDLFADFVAVVCSFSGSRCFMRDNIDVTIEVIACKYESPFVWSSSRKFADCSNGID